MAMRQSKRRRLGFPEPTRPCPATCENCGNPPNGRGSLHLDHDHETGEFRGWLCYSCNVGLGLLGDNAAAVFRVLAYLSLPSGFPRLTAAQANRPPVHHRQRRPNALRT